METSPLAPPIGHTYCTACGERHAACKEGVLFSALCWPCHDAAERAARPPRRVSFFDYDPALPGYRYLTLTEGETIESSHGGQHEEGWSRTYVAWAFDGETVTCETATDGQDCDGRMSTFSRVVCPVADLASGTAYEPGTCCQVGVEPVPLPFKVPAWREAGRSQRDYSAEAAGY